MPLLPDNSIRAGSRKLILLLVIVLFVVSAATAAGFYLYKKQPSELVKNSSSSVLPRDWLLKYFATEDENAPGIGGPQGDPDGDILTNMQEFYFGTNPAEPDSDGVGQADGAEVAVNSNPLGQGELYSTEFARRIADQFLETNSLAEFKTENIEKQVLGILNPPDLEKVEVLLPDSKTLQVVNNSETAIKEYLSKFYKSSIDYEIPKAVIRDALEDQGDSNGSVTANAVYEIVDRLRGITVPKDFLYFHQLNLAAMLAAGHILEIQRTVNPSANIESEQEKIQAQYYQVAVIQKVEGLLRAEAVILAGKYPELAKNYDAFD